MNKFMISGRLTKNVEMKYTSGNVAIANLTVAVNRKFVKQGEERKADFFNCKAFGKTAENINNWFQKGDPIMIIGRVEIEAWDDQQGQRKYFTNVMIDEFEFSGPVKRQQQGGGQQGGTQQQQNDESQGFVPVDDDDELPF
jgi:single-strand DNA-binding protein